MTSRVSHSCAFLLAFSGSFEPPTFFVHTSLQLYYKSFEDRKQDVDFFESLEPDTVLGT